MNETIAVEAVRATTAAQAAQPVQPTSDVADPSAVSRFQAAMGVQDAEKPDDIPFAKQVADAWRFAQDQNQGIMHRIHALADLRSERALSAADMVQLQYEVANLSIQQQVVAHVAEKASSAITTLVRNS